MPPSSSLRDIKILKPLSLQLVLELEKRCIWKNFSSGSTLLSFQDNHEDVYFLVKGVVRAVLYSTQGKKVSYRELSEGSTFGELAAIDGGPRSVTVEAVDDCRVAILPKEDFWKTLREQHEFSEAILKHLVHYLRDLTARVYELSTLVVRNRLHAEIVRLVQSSSAEAHPPTIMRLPTQEELANRIGTHREAIGRELKRLAAIGVVERRGRQLRILDMGRLSRMAQEGTSD